MNTTLGVIDIVCGMLERVAEMASRGRVTVAAESDQKRREVAQTVTAGEVLLPAGRGLEVYPAFLTGVLLRGRILWRFRAYSGLRACDVQ